MRFRLFRHAEIEEMRPWWAIMWPAWGAGTAALAMDFTDLICLGHFKGGKLLPASSSATIVMALTFTLYSRGPSSAMATLSSNAFAAKQDELAGRRLQAGLALTAAMTLLVSPAWMFAGELLYAIVPGEEGDIEDYVNQFARIRLAGILATSQVTVLGSWMSGRQRTRPALIANTCSATLNAMLNPVLIYGLWGLGGLGFIGSPIATVICRWFTLACLLAWAFTDVRKCWPRGISQSFTWRRLRDFLGLAVPLTLNALAEDMNMVLTATMCLHFGQQKLATNNCMISAINMLSTALSGAFVATQARVSYHMVHGNLEGLFSVVRMTAKLILIWTSGIACLLVVLQENIGRIFSADPEVWRLSGQLSFLIGGTYLLLGYWYLTLAVMSGIARPTVVLLGFLIGSYCCGLPVAYLMGFHVNPESLAFWPHYNATLDSGEGGKGCGILGVWIGLALGYIIAFLISTASVLCIKDWQVEIDRARSLAELQQRQHGSNGDNDSSPPDAAGLSTELMADATSAETAESRQRLADGTSMVETQRARN